MGTLGVGLTEFEATITTGSGGGAFVKVPHEVLSALGGEGRIPVRATFDGVPYTGSVVRLGGVPCIGVLKSIRSELGKQVGDVILVNVERDKSERVVEIPSELRAAFLEYPGAETAFSKLSFSHQREHVAYILEGVKPETRERRALRTVMNLQS